jgi:hypothetical protein
VANKYPPIVATLRRLSRRDVAKPNPPTWLYSLLFTLQTIGATVLFGIGIPLYRQVLAEPGAYEPDLGTLLWSLTAIVVIQSAFWNSYRLTRPKPWFVSAFVGTLILFSARMLFVFATSVFGIVFIAQRPGFQIPAFRYVVTLIGLFSLYCYMQELERLGRAFVEKSTSWQTERSA